MPRRAPLPPMVACPVKGQVVDSRRTVMRSIASRITILALSSTLFAVVPSSPAVATAPEMFPLPEVGPVVDMAINNDCIFLGQNSADSSPLVAVDRGTLSITSTVPSMAARDLFVRGVDVYVVRRTGDQVDRLTFDATCDSYDLTEFSLAPLTNVTTAAWASDRLWLDAGGFLAALDVTTGTRPARSHHLPLGPTCFGVGVTTCIPTT
jgi:hypothetical protein